VTQAPDSAANYCYRHPDRQSFVLCQRCGRTICPECQTQAAVGVHCPECVRESRDSAPRTRPAVVTRTRAALLTRDAPLVTYAIIAICVVVFIAEALTGTGFLGGNGLVENALIYRPWLTSVEPWTMVTSLFAHASIIHIALNMFSLWVLGSQLEAMIGRGRYAALFLLSGIGGSVGVLLISPGTPVLGASGAIFGLLGAYFVIARHLGANATQLIVVIGINLALGFVISGVAWQAHVGGLVFGGLIGLIFVRTRTRQRRLVQWLLIAGVVVLLVVLTVVGVGALAARLA
jgi:membrane associated rhomboid family serine protease